MKIDSNITESSCRCNMLEFNFNLLIRNVFKSTGNQLNAKIRFKKFVNFVKKIFRSNIVT